MIIPHSTGSTVPPIFFLCKTIHPLTTTMKTISLIMSGFFFGSVLSFPQIWVIQLITRVPVSKVIRPLWYANNCQTHNILCNDNLIAQDIVAKIV